MFCRLRQHLLLLSCFSPVSVIHTTGLVTTHDEVGSETQAHDWASLGLHSLGKKSRRWKFIEFEKHNLPWTWIQMEVTVFLLPVPCPKPFSMNGSSPGLIYFFPFLFPYHTHWLLAQGKPKQHHQTTILLWHQVHFSQEDNLNRP